MMLEWISGLSVSELWLYGIIFSGIAAVMVQWFAQRLSHALAVERERKSKIITAKNKLRSSFSSAQAKIRLIDPANSFGVYNTISTFIPSHADAIEEFKSFVPKRQGAACQKAWNEYHKTATQGAPATQGAAWQAGMTVGAFFEEKIQNILRFAKE